MLLIVALLAFVSKAHSDDLVKVADVSICKGQTATLDIVLNNPENQYTAIQADLYLPDGIEIEKKDGIFVFELDRISDSHSLSIGAMSGYYRLILSSSRNKEITGSDGKVISLSLKARADLENGSMNCILKKVKLARKDGMGIVIDEIPFSIIVQDMIIVTAKSYNRVYGEANPTFEFTTSESAITGIPEISCEATATSPVGTYDIIISKGSVINNNVTYVNGTLTITKAPLTITAKDYTIKQGEAPPTFEATYEGFKNSETSAVLTMQPMITTTATCASEPGEYDITVSGAEAQNYDISYVKGKLTITQADALTVTAKSYTIVYGDDIPKFEYTSEGATLEGEPSITCEATKGSPAGTYDIIISKGTVTNYNDTYVNGKLTITKAPLTITAKDYTIKQGEALPTFEATYEGFKNSETSAVLTKQPTITTAATSASEPGEYDITVSGAEAQNYEISYVKGKLTITKADALIVTAKSYTITYGDDLPKFEYTSEGATISGTPTITCEAKKGSPAGTYDIVISKGTVTNYNDTYVNGTLTIKKAPLTITAKDYTITQGEALPTFEATYEGFKNGETSAVLTNQPTISTTATSASEPGEYDITVLGAEAQNYEISYVKGKLTIQAQDLIPGDANGDGEVNVADVDYIIERIGDVLDETNKAADVNGDGEINVADVDFIIERIV